MKKKMIVVAIALLILAMAAIGATLAYFMDEAKVTNTLTLGKVDIDLKEPGFTEKYKGTRVGSLLPGTTVLKDPTVMNIGDNAAYVIVTAKILWNGNPPAGAASLTFDGLGIKPNTGWVAMGMDTAEATFYYTNGNLDNKLFSIPANKTLLYKVFKEESADGGNTYYTLTIPTGWDSTYKNTSFNIEIKATAIQSDNLTPDQALEELKKIQ